MSRYVDDRYTGKAETFATRNTSKQVLSSLHHLANEAIPMSERVADLQRSSFSLFGLGGQLSKNLMDGTILTSTPLGIRNLTVL